MTLDPANAEFARLLAASGWTQALAARQLSLSRAVVSRYVSGETRPSETVLRLFKLLLGEAGGASRSLARRKDKALAQPMEQYEAALWFELRQLAPDRRRKAVAAFRKVLAALA